MDLKKITKAARALIEELSGQEVDAISKLERQAEGWLLEVDVVESRARIGDDDLLTTYQLALGDDASLVRFQRIGRHNRCDRGASAA